MNDIEYISGCLCCDPNLKEERHQYIQKWLKYYENLEKSDLFNGTLVLYNKDNNKAVAGDAIMYGICIKCNYKQISNENYTFNANCEYCNKK